MDSKTSLLLLDVVPLSLGVETSGGNMDIIIPKNSTVCPSLDGHQSRFLFVKHVPLLRILIIKNKLRFKFMKEKKQKQEYKVFKKGLISRTTTNWPLLY